MSEEPRMIVLTGGPCAGKSSALLYLSRRLGEIGITARIVPEAATQVLASGMQPGISLEEKLVFQRLVLLRALELEREALRNAQPGEVILCDRGLLDGSGYLESREAFEPLLAERGFSYERVLADRYHAVFHLRTAALGAEAFYSNATNASRYEDLEGARRRDQMLLSAWDGHPRLRVISNASSFEEKLAHLWNEVHEVL